MRVVPRFVAVVALALASTGGALLDAPVAQAATSRAVVVIGGSSHVISFNGTITGLQALQMVASVETLGYAGQGGAVCKINGVGNPAVPGECLGETSGQYWSYWKSPPGSSGWQYSGSGAGSSSVQDGSVEGWQFGTGQPPPYHSFCATAGCAPPPPPPPPPTAAPTPAAGVPGAAGSGSSGGTTPVTNADGTPAVVASDGATTSTTGARDGDRDSEQAGGEPRGGLPRIEADDDDGSPVGVVVAGGIAAALGGAGLWFRRHRRVITP